ncbi:MAG: hypothetical protein GY926_23485 [bacterium]|nr:hypothetical protein [bacterium]MCP4968183.1 hypothetical protein [bacterium]
MKRHEFDPLSFIFGLLFVGVSLPLLYADSDFSFLKGNWVFPAFLVFAGVVILISAKASSGSKDDSEF